MCRRRLGFQGHGEKDPLNGTLNLHGLLKEALNRLVEALFVDLGTSRCQDMCAVRFACLAHSAARRRAEHRWSQSLKDYSEHVGRTSAGHAEANSIAPGVCFRFVHLSCTSSTGSFRPRN